MNISIHALRGEGDWIPADYNEIYTVFQSTPSVGRATVMTIEKADWLFISIHALRGEGDMTVASDRDK